MLFAAAGMTYGQWSAVLSPADRVQNKIGYPLFSWYPDGHISVVPDEEGYIMFWAEFESHRSVGRSQFVEDQEELSPRSAVFGGRGNFNSWDNGGSWLMSVFRVSQDSFVGFYHAEDHWYPHTSNDIAWKSLGVTYSADKGKSWSGGRQIITSSIAKPNSPTWGGTGDCCVVWDHINKRWMCYFQEHWISMAISTDPLGAPGTWKKYYYGDFTQDGLRGEQMPLPGLQNYPGGNPSVHWNTYLNKWVMVWHGWAPARIYLSVSKDGVIWEQPQAIISSAISGQAWYPTIIGNTDVEAGQIARIYYADIAKDFSFRNFETRTITFFDAENTVPASAKIDAPLDGSTIHDPGFTIKTSAQNLKATVKRVEFYVNDVLAGYDNTFPFELSWTTTQKGEYQIQTAFVDDNDRVTKSEKVKVNLDFNLSTNPKTNDSDFDFSIRVNDDRITANLPGENNRISIYNLCSNKVYCSDSVGMQMAVDISFLKPGIYILVIENTRYTRTVKFMKRP